MEAWEVIPFSPIASSHVTQLRYSIELILEHLK